MKPTVFLPYNKSNDYSSHHFFLFDEELREIFNITESFKNINFDTYPIFTSVTIGERKTIDNKKIKNYGLVLDASDSSKENTDLKTIIDADFVIWIGTIDSELKLLLDKIKTDFIYIDSVYLNDIQKGSDHIKLTSHDALAHHHEKWNKEKHNLTFLDVLVPPGVDITSWKNSYKDLGITIREHLTTTAYYRALLSDTETFYEGGSVSNRILSELKLRENKNATSIEKFKSIISDKIIKYSTASTREKRKTKLINIVCYNPTYLFKDLVERFTSKGCIHSDFPLPDADAYIWMRPQEIWHLEYLSNDKNNNEIGVNYKKSYNDFIKKNSLDITSIKERSVAIHHGTCFKPIYQFDYEKLAKSLYNTASVVGVCEFEECYGPSASSANKENFTFQPIGYDASLFNEERIRKETKKPGEKLKIGFVGRAYGTNRKDILQKSSLAEPKGYRKGGDILANIANQLKLRNIDFEIKMLGQNWDELVDYFEEVGIDCKYYARDKDLTYRDFPGVYSTFDILLITARCEGGPVSAIEALSLGIDVVSTDVGVVKYLKNLFSESPLESKLKACQTFDYNKKWHVADIDTAISMISEKHNKKRTFEERLKIRSLVESLTTNKWVDTLIAEAEKLTIKRELDK